MNLEAVQVKDLQPGDRVLNRGGELLAVEKITSCNYMEGSARLIHIKGHGSTIANATAEVQRERTS
jgi:hypothetical protein